MTVKELIDKLNNYVKQDPADTWQLNDVEADAKAYQERCKERENHEVVILDDGMKPQYFAIESVFGLPIERETIHNKYITNKVVAISTDLTHKIA